MISDITETNDKGVDLLIEAMLIQAVKDYEFALKYKDIEPMNKYQQNKKDLANRLYIDCESFFHSDWYSMLCSADGDAVIKRIRKHYMEYDCSILADDETKKNHKRKVPLDCDFV